MEITPEMVDHVALLARLGLSGPEKARLMSQLNDILEHVGRLRELDTEGVEPTYHVLEGIANVMREDRARPCLRREDALSNAPESEAGCFKVPPVIEGDEP